MATEINAGRVAMVPKGEWSASTAYVRLDVVSYHGSSYVCKQDGTGQTPDTATNYWQLLSSGLDPTVDTISAKHYEGSTVTAETSISAAGVISKTASGVTKTYDLPAESGTLATASQVAAKQDALVSGTNIKTINNESILGSGDITIQGGGEEFVTLDIGFGQCMTTDGISAEDYGKIEAAMSASSMPMVRDSLGTSMLLTAGENTGEYKLTGFGDNGEVRVVTIGDGVMGSEYEVLDVKALPIEQFVESDPTVPSYVKSITQANITAWNAKQDTLVSGTNIKTVNSTSLLGSGDIVIPAGATGPQGPKGDQGNSGYTGAAGELEVVNNLTDGGATAALSAEMGKLISEKTMTFVNARTEILTPALEQGPMNADGSKTEQSQTSYWEKRVRTQDFIRVRGAFYLSVTDGYTFNAFWYSAPNDESYVGQIGSWSSTYNGNYDGYIRAGIRKGNGEQLLTPSYVTLTLQVHIPEGYEARIIDSLDSTAIDFALSANQGKVIGDSLFGLNGAMELIQGGLTVDGRIAPVDSYWEKRVVSCPMKVNGVFLVNVGATGYWNIHYYDDAGDNVKQVWQTDGWFDATSKATYQGDWHGYIRVLFKKTSAGTTACTPSDFSLTLTNKSLDARVSTLDEFIPNPTTFTMNYVGEKIAISNQMFRQMPFKVMPSALDQCMAVYGDYVIFFTYNASNATALVYELSTATLLATLALPNSTFKRAHCNACSFSGIVNTSDSIMPLLYLSQWDNDSEKGCFVYDFKLVNGTYSVDLVQTIVPTNVATSLRGAGQTDWVVDPLGYIYSVGYYLDDGATIVANNKTMICRYKLPALSDGAVVTFGDADVLDHFDIPIFTYRQDIIFNNGKILMINGVPQSYDVPCHLLAIDPIAKQIVSDVSLDFFNKEPEGLGITDGKLLIGYHNDATLYVLEFI